MTSTSPMRRADAPIGAPRLFLSAPALKKAVGADSLLTKKAPSTRMLVEGLPQRQSPPRSTQRVSPCVDGDYSISTASTQSSARLFVNPPAFAVTDGNNQEHSRATLGVPMLGAGGLLAQDQTKKSSWFFKKKTSRDNYVKGDTRAAKAPTVFVAPPAFSEKPGRVRKTWGVPMV